MDKPNVNPTLKTLLSEMKADGAETEKLVEVTEQISKATAAKFYVEMMAALTKEDIAEINEKAKDQKQANVLIKERFLQRAEKDAESVKDQIMTDIAKGYLDSYREQKKKNF